MNPEFSDSCNALISRRFYLGHPIAFIYLREEMAMVVSFIAHVDQVKDLQDRLAAARLDNVYEEKIADDEYMFSVRPSSLSEAQYLGGLAYRADALEIDIDIEAA